MRGVIGRASIMTRSVSAPAGAVGLPTNRRAAGSAPTRQHRLPGRDHLVRDEQRVERSVGGLDVALAVAEREREMAREERVDAEPAELSQRLDERAEGAVVDVLEQDRPAEEDDVSAEQASASVVLEQEREVAGGVPRCADALEAEVSERNRVSFGEFPVDRARVEAV